MDFTTRQLRAFHAVAQFGNFARAADAMFISPSGLSMLVRELEGQLGFRLFQRTTRQVSLTEEGAVLLQASKRLLAELDEAVVSIGRATARSQHLLSVGTTPAFAANVLVKVLADFHRQQPESHVSLHDAPMDTVLEKVKNGNLDLGFGVFKAAPGLRRTLLFACSYLLVTAGSRKRRSLRQVKWSELAGFELIVLPPSYPHQQLIDEQLAAAGVNVRYTDTVAFLETQLAMVEAGSGAAIVPSFALPACQHRNVTASQLVEPVATVQFHQVAQAGRDLPKLAAPFTAFVKLSLSRWLKESGLESLPSQADS